MKHACALAVVLAAFVPAAAQDPEVDKRIERLIQGLEDDSKEAREKAVTGLIEVGRPALEALRKAAQSKDNEVKGLALQAIEKIEWGGGLDKLRAFVKERFEDGATVEPLKLKGIQKWFPGARFYEVSQGAAGNAAAGGMGTPRSIFAVRKHDAAFYRMVIRGIFASSSLTDLIRKEKVLLKEHDEAFDFATAFLELYWQSLGANHFSWSGGMASRFEKVEDGWELQSPSYGTQLLFKTDAEGHLVDLSTSGRHYSYSPSYQRLTEEKMRLEVEKLRAEVEALKRQGEEGGRKK